MLNKILTNIARKFGKYEIVAFITGFVLMSYELLASRMLGPYIGSSLYVWTAVIGVMIFALAIGYAVGGFVADNRSKEKDIIYMLVACILLIFINIILYQATVEYIVRIITDTRAQAILATLVLFMPVSFIMGMISPYLAKLRLNNLKTAGQSVAMLSASNSVGGIAGTFATGFIFFAYLNIVQSLVLLIFLLDISILFINYKFNKKYFALVLLTLFILLIVLYKSSSSVAQYDTPMASYQIKQTVKNNREVSLLVMGPGGYQSGVYNYGSKDLVFEYTKAITKIIESFDKPNNILILGGGAYTLPEYIAKKYPQANITVLEIDKDLEQIAKDHFRYEPQQNIKVINQDARVFLNNNNQKFDVIIVDVYSDSAIPFNLSTKEYAQNLHNSLYDNGILLANFIGSVSKNCLPYLSSVDGSYNKYFTYSRYYPLLDKTMQQKQNIIMAYGNKPLNRDLSNLYYLETQFTSSHKLTDKFSPVEHLQNKCKV